MNVPESQDPSSQYSPSDETSRPDKSSGDAVPASAPSLAPLFLSYALLGAAGLAAEVAWSRLLAVTIGGSTYAVSMMLATYMAGIALGSAWAGRRAERAHAPWLDLGLLALGVAAFTAITPWLAQFVPQILFPIIQWAHQFGTWFYLAALPAAALIMLPPAFLMGAAFPYAARLASSPRNLARLYALNTCGSLVGALAAGFILIPGWGLTITLAVTAFVAAAAAIVAFIANGQQRGAAAAAIGALILSFIAGQTARPDGLASIHSMSRAKTWADIERLTQGTTIFAAEGAFGPVVVREDRTGARSLYVAGRCESNTLVDRGTTVNLALLPLAAKPDARSIYILGLGTGSTAVTARQFRLTVRVAELDPHVVDAVDRIFFPGYRSDPGTTFVIGDARTDLRYSGCRFDLFTSEPSYPIDPTTAGCYTEEMYRLVARALNPGGVACQWLPRYLLDDEDLNRLTRTFAAVFHDVTLWHTVGGDLLMLGYRDAAVRSPEMIAASLQMLQHISSAPAPQFMAAVPATAGPRETDDEPHLEFAIARNRVLRTGELH